MYDSRPNELRLCRRCVWAEYYGQKGTTAQGLRCKRRRKEFKEGEEKTNCQMFRREDALEMNEASLGMFPSGSHGARVCMEIRNERAMREAALI